ncbi:single-stranded DNA-binding protein [Candidatus Latescibacterota bacterium]
MARGLNKVLLIGNLGADPEIKYAPSGTAIANFNLATSERKKNSAGEWEDTTEWHRIVFFARQAENCKDYLRKGSRIYLEGRIQTRSWDDQNGHRQYRTEIVGNSFIMLDQKPQDAETGRSQKDSPAQTDESKKSDVQRENFPESDDDLPF